MNPYIYTWLQKENSNLTSNLRSTNEPVLMVTECTYGGTPSMTLPMGSNDQSPSIGIRENSQGLLTFSMYCLRFFLCGIKFSL